MSENVKQEGTFKLQKRKPAMKKLNVENKAATVATAKQEVTKVDLTNKPQENAIQKQGTDESVLEPKQPEVGLQEVGEGNEINKIVTNESPIQNQEVTNVITEIPNVEVQTQVNTLIEETTNAIAAEKNSGRALPENIEKLVTFMEETGGTVEDYVRLNADYSSASPDILLREYYRKSRPHLDAEEIQFIMEENFSYDEDLDDDRDIKRKKLAFKEEVNKARAFLEDTKSKYYDEIKLRPSVNKDQQKAMDFFNRYNKEQESVEQQHEGFKNNTKQFFSQDFKGFDFNLGEKSFRYRVTNPEAIADKQSNITNLIKKFLDKDGQVADVKGYHKAIYAADNADSLAKHFYEQGKADALKEVVAKSNNISTEPRQNAGNLNIGGFKVRAINGVDTSKLRIQKKY
jgi:hypothetical protein